MTTQNGAFKRFLTRKQAAEYLGISVSWLEKHVNDGPPHLKKAGRIIFDRDQLDKWMLEPEGETTDE